MYSRGPFVRYISSSCSVILCSCPGYYFFSWDVFEAFVFYNFSKVPSEHIVLAVVINLWASVTC